MNVDAVAASLAVSFGQVGVALAGAGAIAENVIGNTVEAFIDGGSIVEAAARYNYDTSETLSGTIADPPAIESGDRVFIAADLQDGVAGEAGQIYEYIGDTPLIAREPIDPGNPSRRYHLCQFRSYRGA